MPRRKPKHPGGRPPTTRSASTPPVFYRVSAAMHAELEAEAAALGIRRNELARQDAERGREARLRGIDVTDLGDTISD